MPLLLSYTWLHIQRLKEKYGYNEWTAEESQKRNKNSKKIKNGNFRTKSTISEKKILDCTEKHF